MRRVLTPKWLLSHLFVLAMVVLMVGLGLWQLQRHDDRRARNDQVAERSQQDPVPFAATVASGAVPENNTAVIAAGEYRVDRRFLVGNRSRAGQPGSWLVAPLVTDAGVEVAVVLGFVANADLDAVLDAESIPSGPVVVEGLAFDSVGGGRSAGTEPDAIPEISRMDLPDVATMLGIDLAPAWIRLREQDPPVAPGIEPVPDPDLSDGPHLAYAFQWFFFSIGTVVVYALILRRQLRDDGQHGDLAVFDDADATPLTPA